MDSYNGTLFNTKFLAPVGICIYLLLQEISREKIMFFVLFAQDMVIDKSNIISIVRVSCVHTM